MCLPLSLLTWCQCFWLWVVVVLGKANVWPMVELVVVVVPLWVQ